MFCVSVDTCAYRLYIRTLFLFNDFGNCEQTALSHPSKTIHLEDDMNIQTLEDLYINGLQFVYDAEMQLTEALPKMADAASAPELKQAFQKHLQETREHVSRAEQLFEHSGRKPERNPNSVVKQMAQEAEEMISNIDAGALRDAALIVAGNQVEHYEMACYGSLRNFAQVLGKTKCVQVLEQTLQEEKKADATLTQVGESTVNRNAASGKVASAA